MLNQIRYPETVLQIIENHLQRMKVEKEEQLEKQYQEMTMERDEYVEFMKQYTQHLKTFAEKMNKKGIENEAWPFIIIGSTAEIEDLEDKETEKVRIVSPFESSLMNMDSVSYMSPMGKALLFKQVGDKVSVQTPMGTQVYMVRDIEMPEEGVVVEEKCS